MKQPRFLCWPALKPPSQHGQLSAGDLNAGIQQPIRVWKERQFSRRKKLWFNKFVISCVARVYYSI